MPYCGLIIPYLMMMSLYPPFFLSRLFNHIFFSDADDDDDDADEDDDGSDANEEGEPCNKEVPPLPLGRVRQ